MFAARLFRTLCAGLFLFLALILSLPSALALTVDGAFADHMVLQRSRPIKLSGTARAGSSLLITFHKQVQRVAAPTGHWQTELAAEAAGGPYELKIEGDGSRTFKDVLVGDVFLFAGQSNMYYPVFSLNSSHQIMAAKRSADIRFFKVPALLSAVPLNKTVALWQPANSPALAYFSGIGYLVGARLEEQLKVPVGLIDCTFPGTPIDAWMSKNSLPLRYQLPRPLPALPAGGNGLLDLNVPTSFARGAGASFFFNAMVSPLMAQQLKAIFWYQGEGDLGQANSYRKQFPLMISDWRKGFGQEDLPFIFVQLPRCRVLENFLGPQTWPEMRLAQASALSLPNTYMAVCLDLGEANNIHPRDKEAVADRLAAIAESALYKKDVVLSPEVTGYGVSGKSVKLYFKPSASPLLFRPVDGHSGVEIADGKGVFLPASVRLEKQVLVCENSGGGRPRQIRYGFAGCPAVTLFNQAGLPLAPFLFSLQE